MSEDLEIVDQGVAPETEAQSEPASDMLNKATVSKIVERERLKAFAKGKQEALMELQQQQQALASLHHLLERTRHMHCAAALL
jgi:predicted RNA binding protein with dsRBD fold (UPF0201 family)